MVVVMCKFDIRPMPLIWESVASLAVTGVGPPHRRRRTCRARHGSISLHPKEVPPASPYSISAESGSMTTVVGMNCWGGQGQGAALAQYQQA